MKNSGSPEPITVYGATDCDDTEHTRNHLNALGIPFREVNIDHDPAAEALVVTINGGYRSTPTLVIGAGKRKLVISEPDDDELQQILTDAGHDLHPLQNP